MQDNPAQYWQDLTANYRQMSDGELLELAAKPEELTDVAQQVLRDEMKLRNLPAQGTAGESGRPQPVRLGRPATVNWEPLSYRNAEWQDTAHTDFSHEYTWKTLLCECESQREALDVADFLKKAGIDSWISLVDPGWTSGGARVQVAADQLEQARMAMGTYVHPEPSEEPEEIPEFELPKCPQCGLAEDVILESADPVNAWLCEACGAEWTDPEAGSPDDTNGQKFSSS